MLFRSGAGLGTSDAATGDDTTPPPVPPQPQDIFSELQRASPMRYVHGAPLHNVAEEEEE